MTDHRATDLSYGHLGKATYDPEDHQWTFSAVPEDAQYIRQVEAFKQCIPAAIHATLQDEKQPSVAAITQQKWLHKTFPETFPSKEIVSNLIKAAPRPDLSSISGTLLSVGRILDSDRLSGHHQPQVLATPCGEVGQILRLVRLQTQKYAWEKIGPTITLPELNFIDLGYWMGSGEVIHQIVYSEDGQGISRWLAVRQSNTTTIFRPYLGKVRPAHMPAFLANAYPPSRLNANPVACLDIEKLKSHGHFADLSFNPWYDRQFAVVDSLGYWSIWDIEGSQNRDSQQVLTMGRNGHILDGYDVESGETFVPTPSDGWHQILWICDITTVVIANRSCISVFDLKGEPLRLGGMDLSLAKKSESILDVKRSNVDPKYLYVLTTIRVFWIEIVPHEETRDEKAGVKTLLSYRHFRNVHDASMRLNILDDRKVSVLISSNKAPLVNFYGFSIQAGGTRNPASWQGSFLLSQNPDEEEQLLQSLYFMSVSLPDESDDRPPISGTSRFFFVFALNTSLSLSSGLCVVYDNSEPELSKYLTAPPTIKLRSKAWNIRSQRTVNTQFIVPDGLENEDEQDDSYSQIKTVSRRTGDLHLRIDWSEIFKHVFPRIDPKDLQSRPQTPDDSQTVAGVVHYLFQQLQEAKRVNSLPIKTLLELSGQSGISEDLGQATTDLQEALKTLGLEEDPADASSIVVSVLASVPAVTLPITEETTPPSLLTVYDNIVDRWMAYLPSRLSNKARISKHKIIRQLAIELCLSSIGISLRSHAPEREVVEDNGELSGMTRDGSPILFSPEMTPASSYLPDPSVGLPSPIRTPSVFSQTTNTTGSEMGENPAITRLRQYAVSIRSQGDPGRSKLLSSWVPGADPANFSWEKVQKALAEDSDDDENDKKKRREEARRRRRTEKFLSTSRERRRVPGAATESQPVFMSVGSQPVAAHLGFSSQTVDDQPMTQPMGGMFGSRVMQKGKAKKKRKSGF